jgi:hypothetical protein
MKTLLLGYVAGQGNGEAMRHRVTKGEQCGAR